MSDQHQPVRPSQFILTYGPGSVLETPSGPVVAQTLERLFTRLGEPPYAFEIVDSRLTRTALSGAKIVRIPSNAEIERPDGEPIYPTSNFPYWSLCPHHTPQILYRSDEGCPDCPAMTGRRRREKAGREAIRFVMACESGHLDEVSWDWVVHDGQNGCGPDHYRWLGGGRALQFVHLECPECGVRRNFGQAYGRGYRCSERFPEQGGRPSPPSCSNTAHIIQRGAANLRTPELTSALTIVDIPSRLHNILATPSRLAVVQTLRQVDAFTRENFLQADAVTELNDAARGLLKEARWEDVEDAIDQLLQWDGDQVPSILEDEFGKLTRATTEGAPPVPPTYLGGPPLFEVKREDVRRVGGPGGNVEFRVAPVSRLRMVIVQNGYRRMDPNDGTVVDVGYDYGGSRWYPGVELYGEGLFIDLADSPLDLGGPRADRLHEVYEATQEARDHPQHVWWHTLAHRLIRALSVHAGYSSASIRERVYSVTDGSSGPRGGLLLYTVQPGGDGTLGGLVSLAGKFRLVLDAALDNLDACSNDPLCEEAPVTDAGGAACYSCLLASETSCEHRNLGLDRMLLLDNMP